jgi:peptide/nickel transport system permease protein
LLTATIVGLNFVTDVALAVLDPRMRSSVMGGAQA